LSAPKRTERTGTASALFTPVAGSRVSGAIVDQIRSLIMDGELAPGDRLPPERELAEQFDVSRVSVRDALRVLEVLGLVVIRVGASGGAFVTVPSSSVVGQGVQNLITMTSGDPEDVAETRLVLELGIVTLVCGRGTPADIRDLRALCDEGKTALKQGTYTREHSEAFHARLGEATHNPALALVAESFRGPLSMFELRERGAEAEDARHARSLKEHMRIVDALEAGDRAQARRAITAHLTSPLGRRRRSELTSAFLTGD
jgi:GntR family transcriptional regulator, transcriptional repressor for pyruvate dehydrogenase complex